MLDAVLRVFIPKDPSEVATIVIPILWLRKLTQRG